MRELRSIRRHGRHLHLSRHRTLRINCAEVKAAERPDGEFVVHTNGDTLNADDMAPGYRQLRRVEHA